MSGPYKMKGSSALGYGNQHSSTRGMPFASPAKKDKLTKVTNDKGESSDVTEKYAKEGNESTRAHIASGGTVKKNADGSLTLVKSNKQ